jgi:homoserine dehydrogenase
MREISLALVGFGNVGKAFVRLLQTKKTVLEQKHNLSFNVTGIATGRHGMAVDPNGIDIDRALEVDSLDVLSRIPSPSSILEFIRQCPADVLLENSPVNHETGQPAIDHLRVALEGGMHAITANKGPIVHAYRQLNDLAISKGKRFMFESTVMDGAPIFSVFRNALPVTEICGFYGLLNSCTNLILGRMESGESFEDAVAYAQSIGITESDPSEDIDGWDASVKVAALVNVLMDVPMRPQQVNRQGIRGITPEMIIDAQKAGERWKLVCSAWREGDAVVARVMPQRVTHDSPLFTINETSSYVQFGTDMLPGLGIVESDPGPDTTAYGLLADMIEALES